MSDLNSSITPVTIQTAQPAPPSSSPSPLKMNGLPALFNPVQSNLLPKKFIATLPRVIPDPPIVRFDAPLPSDREGFLYRIELNRIEKLDGDDDFSEDASDDDEDAKDRKERKKKAKKAKMSWQKARSLILASLQKKSKATLKASKTKEDHIFALLSKKQN
jgi:hypothetical protein